MYSKNVPSTSGLPTLVECFRGIEAGVEKIMSFKNLVVKAILKRYRQRL